MGALWEGPGGTEGRGSRKAGDRSLVEKEVGVWGVRGRY